MTAIVNKLLNKYHNMPVESKAGVWFVLCNIVQKGISTITVPIFTRIMNAEQYGNYTMYLSWQGLLLIFTSLNLYYGVFNNAMIKFKDDRDRYVSSMQGLTFSFTLLIFIIYLIFKHTCNQFLGMSTNLVYLLFLQLLMMPALLFWSARQRFEFKYKILVRITLLKAVLNPFLGIIAVLVSENKDVARIFTIVLVEVAIGGVISIYQFYKGKCFFDKMYWKYALLFNIPLIPHYLSGTILNQADRIMIGKMAGISEVAYYSVAYNIGMLMLLFTDAINNSFTPWFYIKMKEKDFESIKKTANSLVILIAVLIIFLLLFAPEVIYIFASKQYMPDVYVIPPVAVTVFYIFAYVLFANIEFYYEENKMIMVASIAAAILNIILNAIFIPIFGYYAAAYTTLACYIVYTLFHYLFSIKAAKKKENISNIYDYKFIWGCSFILICIMFGVTFIYKYFILRYVLIAVLLVSLFIKREKIISIIKGIRAR